MRKHILVCLLSALCLGLAHSAATAEDTVKIGLIVPLTGGQASTGKQLDNAVSSICGKTAIASRAGRSR